MPQSAALEMAYQRLPKHPIVEGGQEVSYKQDVLWLVLHSLFVEGKTIRSQQAFDDCLQSHKSQFISQANEVSKTALDILQLYTTLKSQLSPFNTNDPLAKDINEQLALLVYAGFIRNTPYPYLKAIPRYLKAAQYRLDKRISDPQKAQEISRYAIRYWKDVEKRLKKDSVRPEQENFRWALEELRVSLYAQQLKTAYPISTKRMDKLWEER